MRGDSCSQKTHGLVGKGGKTMESIPLKHEMLFLTEHLTSYVFHRLHFGKCWPKPHFWFMVEKTIAPRDEVTCRKLVEDSGVESLSSDPAHMLFPLHNALWATNSFKLHQPITGRKILQKNYGLYSFKWSFKSITFAAMLLFNDYSFT